MHRLQVDGKFFRSSANGGERVFLKMVTYGPFPEPRPEAVVDDTTAAIIIETLPGGGGG